jgi:hypothetical protein
MPKSRTFWITVLVALGIAAAELRFRYSVAPVSAPVSESSPVLRGPIDESAGGCPQEPCPPDTQTQGGDVPK